MPLDVLSLQSFYGSPLGGVARRLIGRVIRERWNSSAGLSVAAVGYGAPYLERFRDGARRCLALMPAEQGVVIWPEAGRCAAALVDAQMLPLPDGSIDRLLLAHALEAADRPDALLEESWRITAPEGRMIVIVPSRRGVWARDGQHALWTGLALFEIAAARLAPTGGLLADLLGRGASRAADQEALHDTVRDDHRAGRRGDWIAVRGRPHRRGDQAGPSPGRRPYGCPSAARSPQIRARAERSATTPFRMIRLFPFSGWRRRCAMLLKAAPRPQPKANSHARRSSPRPVAPWSERMEPQEPVHRMAGCRFEPRRSRGSQTSRTPDEGARNRLRSRLHLRPHPRPAHA